MTWFKVDDTLSHHAKVIAAGNAAMGLWVRAGAWSMQQLTDGFVPTNVARTLGTANEARRLVKAGLWLEHDGGYLFHQFTGEGRQRARIDVEAEREAARERQRRAREAAALSRRDKGVTDAVTTPEVQEQSRSPRPDQTRPSSGLGSQSPNGRSANGTSDRLDLDRIANLIGPGTDRPWTNRVIRQILERAPAGVRDPQRYVEAAIREKPADYRPTQQPPPLARLCDHGRDRLTCRECEVGT